MSSILDLKEDFLKYLHIIQVTSDLVEKDTPLSESSPYKYYKYIQNYIYAIIAADGHISYIEYEALNEFLDDDESFFEVKETIKVKNELGLIGDPTEDSEFMACLMLAEKLSNRLKTTDFFSFLRELGVFSRA